MTSRSKIVGITRQLSDHNETIGDIELQAVSLDAPVADQTGAETSFEDQAWEHSQDYEDVGRANNRKSLILPVILVSMNLLWTGFFGWTHYAEAMSGMSTQRVTDLISAWSLPIGMIGIFWLILLRSSRAETARFADCATLLRNESVALESRLRTVNEEIATAREFLAQNARELESIGRQSAHKLTQAAEQLGIALIDSYAKAKTLEDASNAATTNLEQLRKHLPVITSAAKDVTNQIGNAGNTAQLHANTLIVALNHMAQSGDDARNKVDSMSERAENAATIIATSVDDASEKLTKNLSSAHQQSDSIAAALHDSSQSSLTLINQAAQEVQTMISQNSSLMNDQVGTLRLAMSDLENQSVETDSQIDSMVAKLNTHIAQARARMEDNDRLATERTAKMAFALETVVGASEQLSRGLSENQTGSATLIENAEHLLHALEQARGHLNTSLPEALDAVQSKADDGLLGIDKLNAKAAKVAAFSDDMLIKLHTIGHIATEQERAFATLMQSSDHHFNAQGAQAAALTETLKQTRDLMTEIQSSARVDILGALNQVSVATQAAADASRHILDQELGVVAEKLTKQNKQALAGAIDESVASINNMMQNSIQHSIQISEQSTQQIAAQLAQIDEMTGNLERRLNDTSASFEATGDDSFARRMLLLTESLNSTAIDVAKILSNDVTDTAWAAYLKGDRGVFTRRAVRLLDTAEARIIADHYSQDSEFRDHVNRYIHDFEAMMRVLLSTRDGNAIGVTLLSSDVGKLYVALAQAIERLRN